MDVMNSDDLAFDHKGMVANPNPVHRRLHHRIATSDFALQNEYGVHDESMLLPLRDGALEGVSGMVKYLPKFREAEC